MQAQLMEELGAPRISDRDRPYVTFHTETEEDFRASREQNKLVLVDVHYAHVTGKGSKDVNKFKMPGWWELLKPLVHTGRYKAEWVDDWKRMYQRYLDGQTVPVQGTPILGWGLVSPAMQQTIIRANIRTVEDLANANADALGQIGMGAVELKRRAEAWVLQHKDKEGVSVQLAAQQKTIDTQNDQIEALTKQLAELAKQVEKKGKAA